MSENERRDGVTLPTSTDEPAPKTVTRLELGFERILTPFERFVKNQAASGIVLFAAAVLAVLLANSDLAEPYRAFFEQHFGIVFENWRLEKTLLHWINDGLMALFFFLLGLEIKRELLAGDLREHRRAALVMIAALGGMLGPAAIYYALNTQGVAAEGWGIPMATDTAFAIGALALLANRVPRGLTAFLAALAIVDDIGAVLVIALFYSQDITPQALLWAGLMLAMLLAANRLGLRTAWPYFLGGAVVWYWVVQSGVHATVAGVLVAAVVPARPRYTPQAFSQRMDDLMDRFHRILQQERTTVLESDAQHALLDSVRDTARLATTPLQRWEEAWTVPVGILVLPIFAFANAGVTLDGQEFIQALTSDVTLGILLGLLGGKILGISLFTWLGLRTGLGRLPQGVRMPHIIGMSMLAGVGFTMSIFIAQLAFQDRPEFLAEAKLGILAVSLLALSAGMAWLAWVGPTGRLSGAGDKAQEAR